MNYVRKLGFEESPDYDFLRELFSKVLKTLGEPDDGIFDWMLLNGGKGWEASQRAKVNCFSSIVDSMDANHHFRALPPIRILHTASTVTATPITVARHDLSTTARRPAHLLSWGPLRFKSSPAGELHRNRPGPQTETPAYNR
jgi:hypothetical protein